MHKPNQGKCQNMCEACQTKCKTYVLNKFENDEFFVENQCGTKLSGNKYETSDKCSKKIKNSNNKTIRKKLITYVYNHKKLGKLNFKL